MLLTALKSLLYFMLVACAVHCQGQVVEFTGSPTLAPPNCNCRNCKCDPCVCDISVKPAAVSVKKPSQVPPAKASIKLVSQAGKVSSVASGTVIESDGIKTKVLTCWHLFREPGTLSVQLADGKSHPAVLLKSNSKLDLALVEFEGSHDYAPFSKTQDTVNLTAYGYEHAGKLQAFQTKIIGYYSYPNARIAGRAQPGRSGGGLFNSSGELVGVCSASGPDNSNESVYISYPAIEKFLGKEPAEKSKQAPFKATPQFSPFKSNSSCPGGNCPLQRR